MPVYSRVHFATSDQGVPGIALHPEALAEQGPVIPVEVCRDAESARASPVEQPHSASGKILVDTGAELTCVDQDALLALGIEPLGQVLVATPQGTAVQHVFPCSISFPGTPLPSHPLVFVIGSTLAPQGLLALLGRDLLSAGSLMYSGTSGSWSIAF